jgi:hypothetical protein
MQFAASSKIVGDMVAKRASERDVKLFVIKNRAAFLANQREHLSDEDAKALIKALNDLSNRSAFKDLNLYLRRRLAR